MEIQTFIGDYAIAIGCTSKPSEFVKYLDFLDCPNLRIQVYKWNLYIFVENIFAFTKRNAQKVAETHSAFKRGYEACKIDILKNAGIMGGRA